MDAAAAASWSRRACARSPRASSRTEGGARSPTHAAFASPPRLKKSRGSPGAGACEAFPGGAAPVAGGGVGRGRRERERASSYCRLRPRRTPELEKHIAAATSSQRCFASASGRDGRPSRASPGLHSRTTCRLPRGWLQMTWTETKSTQLLRWRIGRRTAPPRGRAGRPDVRAPDRRTPSPHLPKGASARRWRRRGELDAPNGALVLFPRIFIRGDDLYAARADRTPASAHSRQTGQSNSDRRQTHGGDCNRRCHPLITRLARYSRGSCAQEY